MGKRETLDEGRKTIDGKEVSLRANEGSAAILNRVARKRIANKVSLPGSSGQSTAMDHSNELGDDTEEVTKDEAAGVIARFIRAIHSHGSPERVG